MRTVSGLLVLVSVLTACHPPAGKDQRFMANGTADPEQTISAVAIRTTAMSAAWAATEQRFRASLKTERLLGEQRLKIPGGAIGVVLDGRLAHAKAFGEADLETQRAFQVQDRITIAAMTKMVTAVTVLRLVEEGRLDLDRPVNDYLRRGARPWTFQRDQRSSEWANRVTLRHVLTQTAGIPDESPAESGDSLCEKDAEAFRNYFEQRRNDPLLAEPGTVWNESNAGYVLAAAVIEAVTGLTFEEVATAKVLIPAGMKTATWDGAEVEAKGSFARGYEFGRREDGSQGFVSYGPASIPCRVDRPALSLMASVEDLAAFAQALMSQSRPLLRQNSLEEWMRAGVPTPYVGWYGGVGTFVRKDYQGLKVVAHQGAGGGYRAVLVMVPERDFAWIALHNVGASFPESLWDQAFAAIDSFLDLHLKPVSPPEQPASERPTPE
ncbi:MAG: serine hydrolase domain-containing protein [Oligoflexus sp.]|jgi:CubicO group peptidase (beta-lactamase class C family)